MDLCVVGVLGIRFLHERHETAVSLVLCMIPRFCDASLQQLRNFSAPNSTTMLMGKQLYPKKEFVCICWAQHTKYVHTTFVSEPSHLFCRNRGLRLPSAAGVLKKVCAGINLEIHSPEHALWEIVGYLIQESGSLPWSKKLMSLTDDSSDNYSRKSMHHLHSFDACGIHQLETW